MVSRPDFSGHLLLVAAQIWGHLRPLSAFACKVTQQRPDIAITLLTAGGYGQRVEREIDRYFAGSKNSNFNIRVVNLGGRDFEPFELINIISEGFQSCYAKLTNGDPVQCNATGKTFDAIRRPDAAIIDSFLLNLFQAIRGGSGKPIPVMAWVPANASMILRVFGPEALGGFGNVAVKAQTQVEATGRKLEDVTEEMYRPSTGNLITVPGLPPMYDYEWSPQKPMEGHPQNYLFNTAYAFLKECDGVVSITSVVYEPEGVEAIQAWLGETNRNLFAIGPLVPPGVGASGLSGIAQQKEMESSDNAHKFQQFLDNMLETHGKNSVIYISFGSFWWPKNENVWIFVNALLELDTPFILTHPSPLAIVPPEIASKVMESAIGLLSAWAPQQTILNHSATGWILTHCGQNSVMESLAQGMPMIAWPIDADQPANATYLTLSLDVAFELIEVRTGDGLKPLYRGVQSAGTVEAVAVEARDVIQRTRSAEGERKRMNAEAIRDKLKGAWDEDGQSTQALRALLGSLV